MNIDKIADSINNDPGRAVALAEEITGVPLQGALLTEYPGLTVSSRSNCPYMETFYLLNTVAQKDMVKQLFYYLNVGRIARYVD